METLITNLMGNKYWTLLRLERGGNLFVRAQAQYNDMLKIEFLKLVMMGFYPLSYGILLAFRQIKELAPNNAVETKAQFFVDVEEGKLAASDWYRGVAHSELYRRMFSSLSPVELAIDEQMLEQYLLALKLPEGGLARAVVTAAFIEKTGLTVLRFLHDFVAQWQVLVEKPTSKVDLTYLNEHMLHEGDASADQHVCIIDELMRECGDVDVQRETKHFQTVTEKWLSHIYERVASLHQ